LVLAHHAEVGAIKRKRIQAQQAKLLGGRPASGSTKGSRGRPARFMRAAQDTTQSGGGSGSSEFNATIRVGEAYQAQCSSHDPASPGAMTPRELELCGTKLPQEESLYEERRAWTVNEIETMEARYALGTQLSPSLKAALVPRAVKQSVRSCCSMQRCPCCCSHAPAGSIGAAPQISLGQARARGTAS
jgi:hypothetical protein